MSSEAVPQTAQSRNRRTLAGGMSLSFVGEVTRIALTYVYGIVIARKLGVDDYGIFFLGVTTFNFAAGLFSFRPIEDSLIRFIGQYVQANQLGRARSIIRLSLLASLGISALFGLLYFVFAEPIAVGIFHKPRLAIVLRTFSVGMPLYAVMVMCVSAIRGFRILKPYVVVNKIVLPMVTLAFAIFALQIGQGLRGLTMAYNVSLVVALALAGKLLAGFLAKSGPVERQAPDYRAYFTFLGSACVINVFLFLFNWSDLILVAALRPARDLGVYTAAKKLAMVLNFLYISLNAIFGPMIAHFHGAGDHEHLEDTFKTSSRWMLTLSLPIYLTIVLFANEILGFFGPAFMEGRTALILMATGFLVHVGVGSTEYILMMTGRQKCMAWNSFSIAIVAVVLGVLAIPRYGINGAAWVNAGMLILANGVALVQCRWLAGVHPFRRHYFQVLLAGALTGVAIWGLRRLHGFQGSVAILLIELAALFIVFFGLTFCFGIESQERAKMREWIARAEMPGLGINRRGRK